MFLYASIMYVITNRSKASTVHDMLWMVESVFESVVTFLKMPPWKFSWCLPRNHVISFPTIDPIFP